MKRSWLGLALLVVLLLASVAATAFMTRIHEEMELDLLQAGRCALVGDWDGAQLFETRIRRNWEKWRFPRSCFADHTPLEDIEANMSTLEVYRQAKEATAYRAACAALAKQTAALGQAQKAAWENLL